MANTYISGIVNLGTGKNQTVYLNNMALTMGWKLITQHPNKDAG